MYNQSLKMLFMFEVHSSLFLLIESSSNGEPPALIQELSHGALSFPELKGEKVVGVDCSEFFSSIMTQSGKVFWW